MYFNDRTTLGKTLAQNLSQFKGKDAVLLCLKESSLLTCLTAAAELRAWVYPIFFAPVYSQDLSRSVLGAYNEEGQFVPNTDEHGIDLQSEENEAAIRDYRQRSSFDIQELKSAYEFTLNKNCMNGRDVILVCDVLTSQLPLAVANELLKSVSPKSLTVAVGNATPPVAEALRMSGDKIIIMDVVSGVVFNDEHYFEHTDAYSTEQKHKIAHNIAAYWQ